MFTAARSSKDPLIQSYQARLVVHNRISKNFSVMCYGLQKALRNSNLFKTQKYYCLCFGLNGSAGRVSTKQCKVDVLLQKCITTRHIRVHHVPLWLDSLYSSASAYTREIMGARLCPTRQLPTTTPWETLP